MGILVAFAVGYFLGAKGGTEGLEEVAGAIRELRESEELEALLAAVRSYVSHALQALGEAAAPETVGPTTVTDLLDRLREGNPAMRPPSDPSPQA